MLDLDGYPNLTDFGLAKDNMGRSRTNTLCGTPEYLAPEVLKQEGHAYEVDWWALGALIFEMLTGLPPFYSKNREELLKNIKTWVLYSDFIIFLKLFYHIFLFLCFCIFS